MTLRLEFEREVRRHKQFYAEARRLKQLYDGLKEPEPRPAYVFLGRSRHDLVMEGRKTKSIFVPGLGMRSYRPIMGGSPGTYYVRADGTAANKGAAGGPGSTQSACMNVSVHDGETFSAADVLVLADDGGQFRDQLDPPSAGSSGNPIIYQPETGDSPIINGSDLVVTWADQGSNIWDATLTTEPTQVFFDGTFGTKETAKVNLNAANEWFWTGNVLSVYSTSDPDTAYTSPGIEGSIRDHCIDINGKSYVTIDGIECRYADDRGINVLNGDNFIIKNLTVQFAYVDGLLIDDTENGLVQNSILHDNGNEDGAEGSGGGCLFTEATGTTGNNTFDSNTSYNNAEDGVGVGGSIGDYPSGIHTIKNNTLHDNAEDGVDIKGAGANIVQDNDIYSNAEKGIFLHDDAQNCIIRRNSIRDSGGWGIYANEGGGYQISHNIIDGSGQYGIQLDQAAPTGHALYNNLFYHSGSQAALRIHCDDVTVINNIFFTDGQVCLRESQAGASTGLVINYNQYHRLQGGADVILFESFTYTEADVNDGTWFAAYGHDEDSDAGDPLMIDPVNDDFHLKSSSPCIETGTTISGLTLDQEGKPLGRGTNPDRGPLETLKGGPRGL